MQGFRLFLKVRGTKSLPKSIKTLIESTSGVAWGRVIGRLPTNLKGIAQAFF
jgi:hypothetical protein